MVGLLFLPFLTAVLWVCKVRTVRAVPVAAHALIVLVPGAGRAAFSHGWPPNFHLLRHFLEVQFQSFAGRRSRNHLVVLVAILYPRLSKTVQVLYDPLFLCSGDILGT